jgi:hypothetical protein
MKQGKMKYDKYCFRNQPFKRNGQWPDGAFFNSLKINTLFQRYTTGIVPMKCRIYPLPGVALCCDFERDKALSASKYRSKGKKWNCWENADYQ